MRRQWGSSSFPTPWVLSGFTPFWLRDAFCLCFLPCHAYASLQGTHNRASQQRLHPVIISNRNWMEDLSQCHCGEHDSPREKYENMAFHVLAVSGLENSQNALSLFPAFPLMPSPSTSTHT